jgi:hypothetical protein
LRLSVSLLRCSWLSLALVVLITGSLAGCGRSLAGRPAVLDASPSAASSAQVGVLAAGDCFQSFASPNSTTTMPLGLDRITLMIPPGWLDQTREVTGLPVLLRIKAPTTYGSDSATFMLVSIPGPRRGSSSRKEAADDARGRASLGQQSSVNDCKIGGENASFFQYRDSAGNYVYRVLILHKPSSKYPFLYAVEISSLGPIENRAQTDIRSILGSWTWGAPVYDPNS